MTRLHAVLCILLLVHILPWTSCSTLCNSRGLLDDISCKQQDGIQAAVGSIMLQAYQLWLLSQVHHFGEQGKEKGEEPAHPILTIEYIYFISFQVAILPACRYVRYTVAGTQRHMAF